MTEPGLAATTATTAATGPGAQRPATRWMQRLAEHISTAPDATGTIDTATPGGTMDPTDAESGIAQTDPTLADAERAGAAQTNAAQSGTAQSGTELGDTTLDDTMLASTATDDEGEPPSLGSGVLFVLALLWLAAMMSSVRASIAGNAADPAVVISSTALALPGIVVATLLAGAAAALAATNRFARPASSAPRTLIRRLSIGAIAGAGTGVVAAGVILFTFGTNAAIGIIAATVGLSALLASATVLLPPAPLAAGIAANLGIFISGALLNLFQSPLKALLGAGNTVASRNDAADRLLTVAALISGIVAGAVAYLYLRRREPDRRWPWYLLAGATPGLASLIGEVVTQLGGASLFRIVGGFSDADQAVLNYLGGARVVSGLIVTFVGGIFAMILVGRTLRRPEAIQVGDAEIGDGESEDGDVEGGEGAGGGSGDGGGDATDRAADGR